MLNTRFIGQGGLEESTGAFRMTEAAVPAATLHAAEMLLYSLSDLCFTGSCLAVLCLILDLSGFSTRSSTVRQTFQAAFRCVVPGREVKEEASSGSLYTVGDE